MSRYDVYAHPDPALRKATPYLLDVQNNYIEAVATRVVVPMRDRRGIDKPLRDLNPIFEIEGKSVVLDTTAIGAFPVAALKKPVARLASQASIITSALDTLFGGY
jgi:toxin CcdB